MNENDRKEAVTGGWAPQESVREANPEGGSGGCNESPSPGPDARGWLSGILINIRVAVRLIFFRYADPSDFVATPAAFSALVLFELSLHLALSVARVGPDGSFNFYSFPYAVTHIPLVLAAGFWIGRLTRREDVSLALATACLAAGIPIVLLAELFNLLVDTYSLKDVLFSPDFDHFHPFFGWWALASLVAVIRMTGARRVRRFGLIAIYGAVLVLPLWIIRREELWSENRDDAVSDHLVARDAEEAIYRQPVLLESAMERLLPGRRGVGDLYFVGFAGFGGQDVFKKEVEVIDGILRRRFDTAGRSLLLVNNPGTLSKYPMATATALERVLKRVGKVMNREEDILLLYLTSHGFEDSHISAELQPMTFHDIYPAMLRRMLDESGIRWRIVIVSACYSGAFLDRLGNDDTLVMTASDATSSSFGCSNDSDFTWFGEALFDKELRRTHSFVTAFNRASAAIAERERKEGDEASHPLISVGKGIAPRLKQLEERLERSRPRR